MDIPLFVRERYVVERGSDLVRDGMYLELWDPNVLPDGIAMFAFFSDETGDLTIDKLRNDVPEEVEAWFRQTAATHLPPEPA